MVWTCRAQERLDISSTQAKQLVVQKRSGIPRKSWDEVLLEDKKKLGVGMDTADLQNRSEWRVCLRSRHVQPSEEDKELYKTDMMMMINPYIACIRPS